MKNNVTVVPCSNNLYLYDISYVAIDHILHIVKLLAGQLLHSCTRYINIDFAALLEPCCSDY